jgi:anti-sigma B factor antagonist
LNQLPAFSAILVHEGDDSVIHVAGELDIDTASTLRSRIEKAIDSRPSRVILDLTNTTFIDSTGLGVILRASHDFGRDVIVIRSAGDQVMRVIQVTGVEPHLTILPSPNAPAPAS